MKTSEVQRANQWIAGRDVGTSSRTIWSVMQDVTPSDADVPYDADDFGRCYRLLALIPEWRGSLPRVARRYPAWSALVREWDRLTEMYERVIGPTGKDWNRAASAALYDAMQPLIDEGRVAAGWVKTGPGSWRKDGGGSVVQLGGKLKGFTMTVGK